MGGSIINLSSELKVRFLRWGPLQPPPFTPQLNCKRKLGVEMDLTQIFCDIDDFIKANKESPTIKIVVEKSKRGVKGQMSLAEMMAIIVYYHSSNFKNFKSYFLFLSSQMRGEFPKILSYSRFVECIPFCLLPLCGYLKSRRGKVTGISYIDSTSIAVCKNIRIPRNRVFGGIASRGKTSMGWFFGFKLHLVVNEIGEILAFKLTRGNTHDSVPVTDLCKGIKGKLYGDKGYLGQKVFKELWETGLHLITNLRGNMKNKLMPLHDKLLLRKRFIIETINDQLKNISNIEHSRHRSPVNFLVNVIAGLISYTYREKKPSIRWPNNLNLLNN
jgi:hypothetical protein